VKTVQGYQAAGVPIWAISVENEPLYAPAYYSGMQMTAEEQALFFGNALGPGAVRGGLDAESDGLRPNGPADYPETVAS